MSYCDRLLQSDGIRQAVAYASFCHTETPEGLSPVNSNLFQSAYRCVTWKTAIFAIFAITSISEGLSDGQTLRWAVSGDPVSGRR